MDKTKKRKFRQMEEIQKLYSDNSDDFSSQGGSFSHQMKRLKLTDSSHQVNWQAQ